MRGYAFSDALPTTSLATALAGWILLATSPALALICEDTTCALSSGASIGYQPTITITKNADIDFGTVMKNSCNYTIDTAGAVTGTPAGSCYALSGSPHAANLTIRGSSSLQVTISVGGYTSHSTVTPSLAKGKYNNGSEQSFPLNNVAAPTSAGKTLLIGATVSTAGTETIGVGYTPSFTITVIYP